MARRLYKLYTFDRPGYVIGCQEPPQAAFYNDIQFRIDMAHTYQVGPDEGYFKVFEDGEIVNELDIPR